MKKKDKINPEFYFQDKQKNTYPVFNMVVIVEMVFLKWRLQLQAKAGMTWTRIQRKRINEQRMRKLENDLLRKK